MRREGTFVLSGRGRPTGLHRWKRARDGISVRAKTAVLTVVKRDILC